MSGDERKPVKPESKEEDYESTVLDFLDQEIAASGKSQPKESAQPDDVDAIVSNLLREVMTASGEQETSSGSEATAPPPRVDARVHESAPKPAVQAVVEKAAPKGKVFAQPDAAGPRTQSSPLPSKPVASGKAPAVPVFGFSPAQQRPRATNKLLLVAAALICLLGSIGFGIYHFSGSSSDQSALPLSQAAAPSVPSMAPSAQSAAPVPASPKPAVTTPAPQAQAAAPAAGESGHSSAAPAKAEAASAAKANAPVQSAQDSRQEQKNLPAQSPAPAPPGISARAAQPQQNAAAPEQSPSPASAPVAEPVEKAAIAALPPPENNGLPTISETLVAAPVAAVAAQPRSMAVPVSLNTVSAAPKGDSPSVSARNVFVPPSPVYQPSPVFPESAKRMRLSGTVVLDLQIDITGKVTKATPVSGLAMLTAPAIDAAVQWRYKPASLNGRNIPSVSRAAIVFKAP